MQSTPPAPSDGGGDWPALAAARWQRQPRTALHIDGEVVGSVADLHVPALQRWPQWVRQDARGLHLTVPPEQRNDALASMNHKLCADGLIVAWRDEPFPLYAGDVACVLATFERAATRFWGTLTRGAHCNGFVAGADGTPSHLWIARRADHKATDPGKLDNLIGGGVPLGQTPQETLVREGFEEAGLSAQQMAAANPGRVLLLDRDVPEGRMVERIHGFDLELAPGLTPVNQDGEVAALHCVPIAEAAQIAAGDAMTVDAALVTLDFLLRHRLLPAARHAELAARMEPLLLSSVLRNR